jgi:hypothetical protein
MTEVKLPPSGEGTVIMDVGGDTGALVVYTPASLAGREIEIIRRGETTPFVHTEVRERRLPAGSMYAGVFPGVPAGNYTLVPTASLPALEVSVGGGQICEITWGTSPGRL